MIIFIIFCNDISLFSLINFNCFLFDRLPEQYATPELNIACPDTEKFPLVERLSTFAKSHYDHDHLTLIDGVRVRTIDGWWLVRASNTEAALVARAEGSSIEALERLVKNIETALGAAGLTWQAECKT